MTNNINIVIVVVTIIALSTLIIFPTDALARNGDLYIHIRGAFLGDNLKVTAETDQYSWEWRDTFIFA